METNKYISREQKMVLKTLQAILNILEDTSISLTNIREIRELSEFENGQLDICEKIIVKYLKYLDNNML